VKVQSTSAPAARRTAGPAPFRPRLSAPSAYAWHHLLARGRITRWLARVVERSPRATRWFTAAEKASKEGLFGCRMCGQCALPATGYACPMTCPKELRNGPCGGVGTDGRCEVEPGMRCVWVVAWERAEGAGHGDDLARLQRPVDQRVWGGSSWLNYWQGRDEGLWTEPVRPDGPDPDRRPLVHRELGLTPAGPR
jgi:hypothetical protein